MSKLASMVAGIAVLPVLAISGSAMAVQPYGSIGGGDIYQSKNVTNNGTFADVTNATCGDTVKLRVYIHNPGPNVLENVKVKATLPTDSATSFSSTMTVSASNANPSSEADTTTIKSDQAATLNYVVNSAEYFNASGGRIGSLSNDIVTTGADLPDGVAVSTKNARYAQFQATLNCATPPTNIKVCELSTKNIVTIKESDFDSSKYSKDLSLCNATVTTVTPPTTLTNTGPGSVVAIAAVVAVAAAAAYNWVLRRQNAR